MAINQPTIIPEPWASQGSRTTIPDATGESGRASWSLGFPPETALPLGSGGIPPHWLDFQGVLYALSNHAFFKQSGGRYAWDPSLDYPAGACIIGSNGKVYQALQDSGPGYSAGAKNPTTSGNSAYWGVLATPDGSSIIVNGSGKLAVSATNLASQLADGTTITASGGKLTAVNQGGDASSLADGETIVASNNKLKVNYGSGLKYDTQTGKLIVNFSDLTVEQIAALCDPDGGIAAGADGLYVDFDTMPTDKFEALLKSLKMQIPLEATLQLYVNGATGSDSIVDGRGSSALPFQTISACANYATSNYALGTHNIYINVASGTYTEDVVLPTFNRTTGSIIVRASDSASPPTVVNSTNTKSAVSCSGGSWIMQQINVAAVFEAEDDGVAHFPGAVNCDGGSTSLAIRGCDISATYSGAAPSSGSFYLRVLAVYNGATLSLSVMAEDGNSITCTPGNCTGSTVLHVERFSRVSIPSANVADTGVEYAIACSGSATTFCSVSTNSSVYYVGGGLHYQHFTGTMTGKKYNVVNGSGVSAPYNGFPGDASGTAESSTYSWYEEQTPPA